MNLLIFSVKPKLKSSLLIILITLKSIWKKVLNLWLALYTLFWYPNKRLLRNLLRKTLIQILSNHPHLYIVHWSYSSRKKMVHYISALTSMVLTVFPKKIAIHSCLFLIYWTYLIKLKYIQRYIFVILTTWFKLPMVINRRLLLEHVINHLNGL